MALIKFGPIPSIEVGQIFPSREPLAIAGVHRSYQKGILTKFSFINCSISNYWVPIKK